MVSRRIESLHSVYPYECTSSRHVVIHPGFVFITMTLDFTGNATRFNNHASTTWPYRHTGLKFALLIFIFQILY